MITAVTAQSRWRVLVVGAWIAAAALLLPFAAGLEARLEARARVAGSESARAEVLLARAFDTPLADPLILVIEGLNPAADPAQARRLSLLLGRFRTAVPGIRTISYLDAGDPLFIGADAASTVVLIAAPGPAPANAALVAKLHETADAFFVSAQAPPLLRWTSESMVNDELRELSARDANAAELLVLPLALFVLLIAFGSVTAGLAPLAIAFLTVALARGALALIDSAFPLSVLSANVATMLGLGLSVDYALLVTGRFREELDRLEPRAAALATMARAAHTVLLSGLGVAIALAALLMAPINEVRSIAIAGLAVVVIAVAVCTTLLPAILSFMGSRIDVFLPLRRRFAPAVDSLWRAWARIVFARPIMFAALAAGPLAALAMHCASLDISLPRGEWLPRSARAAEAMQALDRIGRTGMLQTVHVVARLETPASRQSGWRAIAELDDRLSADPRVTATRTIVSAAGPEGWRIFDSLSRATRETFLNADARMALIAVVPRADLELHELSQLVRDLRAAPRVPGVAELSIGGPPAHTADYIDAISRWFAPVVVCILVATFLVLAIGLRSLLLPLKAVALNLLSVAAALGAMTLVFQDGAGSQWLGLSEPTGAVFPIIPILVFSIVFGLSMDYEVFLFGRVVEAHRGGACDLDAMIAGLRATGGIITGAAALMIIVFGAFTLGEFLLMKMLGFSLAVAILIDAVLVRLVLGPALFAIAGRWNWWPFHRVRAPPVDAAVAIG